MAAGPVDMRAPSLLRLFLFRHGESVYNRSGKYSGRRDVPLTRAGRATFRQWSRLTRDLPVAAVYCSPLERARESACILVGDRNVPVHTDRDLIELDFGTWEGRAYADIRRRDAAALQRWVTDPWRHAPPGGETVAQVAARVRRFAARLRATHRSGNLFIVAHITPIKLLLVEALDVAPDRIFRMYLAPGSLSVMDWMPGAGAVIRGLNWLPSPRRALLRLPVDARW